MKQNTIFSYVKRNNNNSEGDDGNEQCSSNVKEGPNPSGTNAIKLQSLKMEQHIFQIPLLFAGWPNSECSR